MIITFQEPTYNVSPLVYGQADFCPHCNSVNVFERGGSTTLVGWSGGPEDDPNHHTYHMTCKDCKMEWSKNFVICDKSVWYIDGHGFCVAGMPTCCETMYFIPCKCGGWREHSCRGKSTGFGNKDGEMVPMQAMYWECMKCHERTPDEHWPNAMNGQQQ